MRVPLLVAISCLALSCSTAGEKPADSGGNGGSNTASAGSASGGGPGSAGMSSNSAGKPGSGGVSSAGGSEAAGGAGNGGGASNGGSATADLSCRSKGDGKSTITLINHCAGTLAFRGSDIEPGELAPGAAACRDMGSDVESIPAIRFWGYIGEDPGPERHTLAELTLNTDFNDFDWYNISHVDAHNLPMQVAAVDMPDCRTLTCENSLLADCPAIGQLEDSNGVVISCFNPTRDDKNSVVAQYFEAGCADAYSWSGDDQGSVVACAGEDYDVVFCP